MGMLIMVAMAEILALLALGLLAGILATVFDVLVFGAASFVSHAILWVLLNVLLAVHVDGRIRAMLWSIPFSFGFIEFYYLTTSASYEGFPKSLAVPLAGMALLAPLIAYAAWTAKRRKNFYGRLLSLLIVGGSLGLSYYLNRSVTVYDGVVAAVIGLVLLALPVRRIKISSPSVLVGGRGRASKPDTTGLDAATPEPERMSTPEHVIVAEQSERPAEEAPRRQRRRQARHRKEDVSRQRPLTRRDEDLERREQEAADTRRNARPTRRRRGTSQGSVTTAQADDSRRKDARDERRSRDASRRTPTQRRTRRESGERNAGSQGNVYGGVSTLGTARVARPSTRSDSGRSYRYRPEDDA